MCKLKHGIGLVTLGNKVTLTLLGLNNNRYNWPSRLNLYSFSINIRSSSPHRFMLASAPLAHSCCWLFCSLLARFLAIYTRQLVAPTGRQTETVYTCPCAWVWSFFGSKVWMCVRKFSNSTQGQLWRILKCKFVLFCWAMCMKNKWSRAVEKSTFPQQILKTSWEP